MKTKTRKCPTDFTDSMHEETIGTPYLINSPSSSQSVKLEDTYPWKHNTHKYLSSLPGSVLVF